MASGPVVAYQGEPGAYSEQAAFELLGRGVVQTKGYPRFDDCFAAVESGAAAMALMPIENSLGGSIHANYDLQLKNKFFVVAEHEFRVRHMLMALPGVKLNDLDKVISHPQALAQCSESMKRLGLKSEVAFDTAGSAKMIRDKQDRKTAAIASALAADYYGLDILEKGVEDDSNNFTRFLLLSKRWMPLVNPGLELLPKPVVWKTSMVFSLINDPGVLHKALSVFSLRGISLTKLESRPDKMRNRGLKLVLSADAMEQRIPANDRELLERLDLEVREEQLSVQDKAGKASEGRFQFLFYVDCQASLADRTLQNALRHLAEIAVFLRILGCYPCESVLLDHVAQSVGAEPGQTIKSGAVTGTGATKEDEAPRERMKIGILGFGNFGQFLAKTFVKSHDVYGCSRRDYTQEAKDIGLAGYGKDAAAMFAAAGGKLDCLVISVSILSFEKVLRALPQDLLRDVLVVDVCSVKRHPKSVMQVVLPEEADILCTHPMFGPESGKHTWRSLPCVYEKVRIAAKSLERDLRCERFLDIFRNAGCSMVDMSCEAHDEAAAGSQFVTHFTGRMLGNLELQKTPIATKGFETLLDLVENTCKDSFDLFSALYKFNPNSSRQLVGLQQAMQTLIGQLLKASGPQPSGLSEFVGRIQPSKTSETHALALELNRQGQDIVTTLTVGEPDFAPPQPILDAVNEAVAQGLTRYTAVGGKFELKEAIAEDYARRKGVQFDPAKGILVTHGGKQSIFCLIMAVCNPGDQVIVPTPYWVSYADIVRMSGATPTFVERAPENDYLMTPEQLEAAIGPSTRMLILCNPCNPTGCLYTREHLEGLAAVLRKPENAHVTVMCDEIYERLTYDGLEHVAFASMPGMAARTFTVNGFAKGFAMTGFRLGYLAGEDHAVISAALKLQSQVNSCPCSISQHAGIAALRKVPDDMLAPLYKQLDDKRGLIVEALRTVPHVVCPVPKGAFYVFPDVSYYLGKGAKSKETGFVVNTTTDLCKYLIKEHGLALPPGDAFGAPYGVRFSYAASAEDIERAVARLRAGLQGLAF
ncbi:Bifunctional aspartate aminotransferase and glutamate/aspartate-prephenate aminotransferase (PhPPA-AT) [Durusdinium trenchii]|uniref:Bifunctional aspartate aminotransferase and glutamate/aspartate-prephenate aminotransferase (PhPPA-AT) n=1 Tax=Durusdinium trenchii TaxID=1381693 RepID=A0ABP0NMP6_9DINO